jgi:hypothetical protein
MALPPMAMKCTLMNLLNVEGYQLKTGVLISGFASVNIQGNSFCKSTYNSKEHSHLTKVLK